MRDWILAMHNLARPPVGPLLEALRISRSGAPALPALSPDTYARAHAAFEARSDQRDLIAAHLRELLATREAGDAGDVGPVAVLSVGCGDGTLDAELAAALTDAAPSRPVRYVGVDPHAASTTRFADALHGLRRPHLSVEVHTDTFAAARVAGPFDVVTFVHSMYYVDDVEATLRSAHALLRPGGEVVVLTGPRGALNALTAQLAPPVGGRTQWFADDVAAALDRSGLPATGPSTLEAELDLEGADADVLDFTVQARLTPELRGDVRDYLDAISPGPGASRVPHPVEVLRVRRPSSGS